MGDENSREDRVNAAVATTPTTDPGLAWLEPLYREHARAVLRTARRVTGSLDDAEDVLHTVFMRLARREHPPDLGDGALAYLRRAATNAALDLMTSSRKRTTGTLEPGHLRVVHDDSPGPERAHHGTELADALRHALASINRRGAEMFALRYLEDLDNHAIAELFDTTPGSVAVTLHRIRTRLREELGSLLGGI